MRYISLLLLFVFVVSCKTNQEAPQESNELIMAPRSEMALLMNEMFAFNESIKAQVISGDLNNAYPSNFDKIHTAQLTDPTDKDAVYDAFAEEFVAKTKLMFDAEGPDLRLRYNDAVNACISCHNKKCTGPLPRIKKLIIP